MTIATTVTIAAATSVPYYMGYDRNYGQPVRNNTRVWRGNDGRYYCKRDNGTTGLLVGAGVGALLGHEVAGSGGDRTLGPSSAARPAHCWVAPSTVRRPAAADVNFRFGRAHPRPDGLVATGPCGRRPIFP